MKLFNWLRGNNSTTPDILDSEHELLRHDAPGTSVAVQQDEPTKKTNNTLRNTVVLAAIGATAAITYFVTKATEEQNAASDPSANPERAVAVFRGNSTFYNESILPDFRRPGGAHALPLVVEWACSELLNNTAAAMWGLQAMLAQHFRDSFCSVRNVTEIQSCVDNVVRAVVDVVQENCNQTSMSNYTGRIFSSLWPTATLPNSTSLDRRVGAPAISFAMNITNK